LTTKAESSPEDYMEVSVTETHQARKSKISLPRERESINVETDRYGDSKPRLVIIRRL